MTILHKEFNLFGKKIPAAAFLLFSVSIIAVLIKMGQGTFNNYLIFKGVFWHTLDQTNLFTEYPKQYFDTNHYGPFFSLIIAPFAILPDYIACLLWGMLNAFILYYAINKLKLSTVNQNTIILICASDMITSMQNNQFNPLLCSWIIFSYILVINKKDFWATLFIVAGMFVKIYGVVGLVFFLFSDKKMIFIGSCIFWFIVCLTLPMIISSPSFVIQCYYDWYLSLSAKNVQNHESFLQGMTAFKGLKNTFRMTFLNETYFLIAAGILSILPSLRMSQFKEKSFQLSYLSFVMIALVIFSSSAESATYIIAMTGVGIWYVIQEKKTKGINLLLLLAIIFTSLSTTDLFPMSVKLNFIWPYGLKALPCFAIWLVLAYQLNFKMFTSNHLLNV
ncbi:MAG: glycosyltransferase family 87 protein [Bacteroidota bacterium]